MRNLFERQLGELNQDLMEMGFLIEKALERIIDILDTQDAAIVQEIKGYEEAVDELERKIQSEALRILYTQQPVARDLRSITAALNLITDMERIADQAYDIAEIAMYFKDKTMLKKPEHIVEMVKKCILMVKGSVDAFVTQNLDVAQEVINSDDMVDQLFLQVRDDLVEILAQDGSQGEQVIDFIMIAKYLERIADHAVNISEWVIFNITGEHKNQKLL